MSDDSAGLAAPEDPDTGEAIRERIDRDRAERVAARRVLLELTRGDPRDLDAAAVCECACHPRPGSHVHRGEPCMCQLTEEERARRRSRAEAAIAALGASWAPVRERHQAELAAAAARLGVEAAEECPFAPLVLVGMVDGRAFAMRERGESYSVVIAPDDNPGLNPWGAARDAETITVATGATDDLYAGTAPDYGEALTFIVATIRTYLRRRTCTHDLGGRYCVRCGAPLIDEALA